MDEPKDSDHINQNSDYLRIIIDSQSVTIRKFWFISFSIGILTIATRFFFQCCKIFKNLTKTSYRKVKIIILNYQNNYVLEAQTGC